MKNFLQKISLILFSSVFVFLSSAVKVSAAPSTLSCYCENSTEKIANCFYDDNVANICVIAEKDHKGYTCVKKNTTADCDAAVKKFNNDLANSAGNGGNAPSGGIVGKFLPKCVTADKVEGDCRDVTIFLILMFNIITYLFSIIGGVALLYFVYGGFVFILSQGNAEKVAQGKGIIVAAVLGIVIAFGGYALVSFVGQIVGLHENFTLK